MRFIHEHLRLVRVRHIHQRAQIAEIAIHRINSFDDDEVAFPFVAGQSGVERLRIVMLEALGARAGQHRAIAQAQMRAVIHDRHIAFAQQPGDRPERSAETAVEKHRVFVTEEFRHPPLELPMQVGHAREHRRTARAQAVGAQRLVRGRDHFRMIGEAEIIVGTEIDDRMRLAVVIQRRPRFGRAQHLRLVKFDGPFAHLMPAREGRRRLERILAVADEKVAQAEFARDRFPSSKWHRFPARIVSGFNGITRQGGAPTSDGFFHERMKRVQQRSPDGHSIEQPGKIRNPAKNVYNKKRAIRGARPPLGRGPFPGGDPVPGPQENEDSRPPGISNILRFRTALP